MYFQCIWQSFQEPTRRWIFERSYTLFLLQSIKQSNRNRSKMEIHFVIIILPHWTAPIKLSAVSQKCENSTQKFIDVHIWCTNGMALQRKVAQTLKSCIFTAHMLSLYCFRSLWCTGYKRAFITSSALNTKYIGPTRTKQRFYYTSTCKNFHLSFCLMFIMQVQNSVFFGRWNWNLARIGCHLFPK